MELYDLSSVGENASHFVNILLTLGVLCVGFSHGCVGIVERASAYVCACASYVCH